MPHLKESEDGPVGTVGRWVMDRGKRIWLPSRAEIERATAAIKAGWDHDEFERRRSGYYLCNGMTRPMHCFSRRKVA